MDRGDQQDRYVKSRAVLLDLTREVVYAATQAKTLILFWDPHKRIPEYQT
jgi:hypothetical protein